MTLFSPYFLADPQLVACDAGTSLLQSGSSGSGVERLQRALRALGYVLEPDGVFGADTTLAVKGFQGDQGLQDDGQVGHDTIGLLDGLMTDIPADPNVPDPAATGLVQLAQSVIATKVLPWATSAIDWLNRWPAAEDHTGDADWDRFHAALESHFHASSYTGDLQEGYDGTLLPIFHAVKRSFDATSPFIPLAEVDETGMRHLTANRYSPAYLAAGAILYLAPPFRNALNDDGRAALLIRVAVRLTYQTEASEITSWSPTCGHYATLTGDQAFVNAPSYAAFAADLTETTMNLVPPVIF
jgi:peptidoglycan hydrolase-like protein with peptidoglycan-binding domain